MPDLSDATIVLTGATGGLGRRILTRLLDDGATVVAVARDTERLAGLPDEVTTVSADLRDPSAPKLIADAVGDHLSGVVHAAGVVAFGTVDALEDETIDALFATNVVGPLRVTRTLLPALADGGFVAAITGIVADQPMAGLAAYSASKAAFSSALTALRREVRRQGIDVIELRPPHTETGLADRPVAGTAPTMPTGADPDDVAGRIVAAIRDRERTVMPGDFTG